MTNGNLTDTGEKMIFKDHDILIAVHTLQQEMMRRFDENTKANELRHTEHEREIRTIALNQAKLDGDITSIKGMYNSLDERIDGLENKNIWMTGASWIGIVIAGVIAWFKS